MNIVASNNMIDWEQIHQIEFASVPGCWKECNSYCCTHQHPLLTFSLLRGFAGMILLQDEFEFLKNNSLLQNGFEEDAKYWAIPINDELSIKFVTTKCTLGGICSNSNYRPLSCKLYPFFPKINIEPMEIEGFISSMVFDQLWAPFSVTHPCVVYRQSADELLLKQRTALAKLFHYPYLIFYLKITELYLSYIEKYIVSKKDWKSEIKLEKYSAEWEKNYLARRAIDLQSFKSEVGHIYNILRSRYPNLTI